MIILVKIIDRNAFNRVLLIRVFTDKQNSRTWASHQIIAIRRKLADQGSHLRDIEAEFTDFRDSEIDVQWIDDRSNWRS